MMKQLAETMAVTAARQAAPCPTCKVGIGRACIGLQGTTLQHSTRGLAAMMTGEFDRVYRETMATLGYPVQVRS